MIGQAPAVMDPGHPEHKVHLQQVGGLIRNSLTRMRSPWAVTKEKLQKCQVLFKQTANPTSKKVDSKVAAAMLAKSGLPRDTLSAIWKLSDQDNDGALNATEFICALQLIDGIRNKQLPLPHTLPFELVKEGIEDAIKLEEMDIRHQRMSLAIVTDYERAQLFVQARLRGNISRMRATKYFVWQALHALERQEEAELRTDYEYFSRLQGKYMEQLGHTKSNRSHSRTRSLCDGERDAFKEICDSLIARVAMALQNKNVSNTQITGTIVKIKEGETKIDLDLVQEMILSFESGSAMPYSSVWVLLKLTIARLFELPNLVRIQVPKDGQVIVVGDLHGQLDDLLKVLEDSSDPSESNYIIFNGDFVDRGQNSCEVMCILMALFLAKPGCVFLNRGNHEAADVNMLNGFEAEVLKKYDNDLFELFTHMFACLPMATLVGDEVFVVHGGLSWKDFTLKGLDQLNRFLIIPEKNSIFNDMLWSDPSDRSGKHESRRGAGCQFGGDVTAKFLRENGLSRIIRSHECVDGIENWFNRTLITVFSASNYCGDTGNIGGFLTITPDLQVKSTTFYAEHHKPSTKSLKNQLVHKLQARVADRLDPLHKHWQKVMNDGREIKRITRTEWRDGLEEVLNIKEIPYLYFAQDMGIKGQVGDVDPDDFLGKFVHFKELGQTTESDPALLQLHFEEAYKVKRFMWKLLPYFQALFRNIDGELKSIPIKEFTSAVHESVIMCEKKFDPDIVNEVIAELDHNHNGWIDVHELDQGDEPGSSRGSLRGSLRFDSALSQGLTDLASKLSETMIVEDSASDSE